MKPALSLAFAVALTGALFAAGPAAAVPQCYELRLFDTNGTPVPVNPPLVGIMLGGRVLVQNPAVPAHAREQAGNRMPCPPDILKTITELFANTCTTEDRRAQAMKDNGVERSIIDKGCTDLADALKPAEQQR